MKSPVHDDDIPLIVVLCALLVAVLSPIEDFVASRPSNGRRRPARERQARETADHVAWLRSLRSLRPHACTEQTCPQHGPQNRPAFVHDDASGYTADWDGRVIAVRRHGSAQVEHYPKLAAVLNAQASSPVPLQRPGT